ncbi:MAG: DUF3857 domain-containing protein [Bacteroidales bacterium]
MNRILFFFTFFISLSAVSQNYDAVVLKKNSTYKITPGGILLEKHAYEIQINSRKDEDLTHIVIPYSGNNKIRSLEGYITDANGKNIRKLKKKDVSEKSMVSRYFYEDDNAIEFWMKHNEYPYTIAWSYEKVYNKFFFISDWKPFFHSPLIATKDASMVLTIPEDYEVMWHSSLTDDPAIENVDGKIRYTWRTSWNGSFKSQRYAPAFQSLVPRVQVIPSRFVYGKEGSQKTWKEFGNWVYDLFEVNDQLSYTEINRLKEVVKDATTKKEKIRLLFHFLQDNTRYINVSIDEGGLIPYPASYVEKNRFGDCKALANYFQTVLEQFDIESNLALVWAGDPVREVLTDFPSQQFNHVILYIPLEDEELWLDATSKYSMFVTGTGTHNQNRHALIIEKDNSRLQKIPAMQKEEVLQSRKIEVDYLGGKAKIKMENTFRGENYAFFNYLNTSLQKKDMEQSLNHYWIYNGWDLTGFEFMDTPRDSAFLKARFTSTAGNLYNQYGRDMLVENVRMHLPFFEAPQDRHLPLQLDMPVYLADTLVYDIPRDFTISTDTSDIIIESNYGRYIVKAEQRGDQLWFCKELLIQPGVYAPEDYADFYEFYYQVRKKELNPLFSLTQQSNTE